jgi:hypothetical protein
MVLALNRRDIFTLLVGDAAFWFAKGFTAMAASIPVFGEFTRGR